MKCSLYFKKRTFAESLVDCGALSKDAGTCIKENYHLTDEVVDDETIDNNLRFIGADPENYVWFNEELWRIIGVMNNIDDGTGKKETRLKIIRDEPIGEYSWDNKANGVGSSISDYGSNDWSDSALQIVLNSGAYWNRTTGDCPYGMNNAVISCDFSTIGLTSNAKNMVDNSVWHLGGSNIYDGLTAEVWYGHERGNYVYNGRPTSWTGKVALMYPSDYGYATSGGITTSRDECLNLTLTTWSTETINDCKNTDWLYTTTAQWILNTDPTIAHYSMTILRGGSVTNASVRDIYTVNPVVHLKSSVKIISGVGTKEQPYLLSL